jgi:hypothetical protein
MSRQADRVLADALGDDLVEAGERTATDEEDVLVSIGELLVRVLTRPAAAPAPPSRIFNSACWTPSPHARDRGLSALRAILSTRRVDDPVSLLIRSRPPGSASRFLDILADVAAS